MCEASPADITDGRPVLLLVRDMTQGKQTLTPAPEHIKAIVHLTSYLYKTSQWCLNYRWQPELYSTKLPNTHRTL